MTRLTGKIRAPTIGCSRDRAGQGEAGRGSEQCAGKRTADDKVLRCELELVATGLDHGRGEFGRFNVVHRASAGENAKHFPAAMAGTL
jgi:hypothetical protein